ncbi:hypothetical protein ABER75_26165 [Niallia taxi]|uniref:hypothetical protein n=1 Tax=Niallia taxi TaxID=2499688 RepID=UPI003D2BC6D4
MVDIIKILIAPLIGLLGVFVGSRLKQKSDIKIQKEFLAKEIKINKLQEVSHELSDMMREVVYSSSIIVKKIRFEVSDIEFRNLNDDHQERMIKIYRSVKSKMLFLNQDHQERITIFYNMAMDIDDKIFEGFHYSDLKDRRYADDEITFEAIKDHINDATEYIYDVIERLNKELLKELEGLK